jgi:hypothetical protein
MRASRRASCSFCELRDHVETLPSPPMLSAPDEASRPPKGVGRAKGSDATENALDEEGSTVLDEARTNLAIRRRSAPLVNRIVQFVALATACGCSSRIAPNSNRSLEASLIDGSTLDVVEGPISDASALGAAKAGATSGSEARATDTPDAAACVAPSTVGDAGSCADRTAKAWGLVQAAESQALSDLSCQADSECVFVSNSTNCSFGCGVLLSKAGSAKLACAIDQANATVCANFTQDGCRPIVPPCVAPAACGLGACVTGQCQDFPPAAWDSLTVDEHSGNSISLPPRCSPGGSCSLWTVTPDARVVVVNAAGTHTATMSPADFATADSILRSEPFRRRVVSASTCDPSSGGPTIVFEVTHGGSPCLIGLDVSGCVLVGPTGNDAQRLFNTVTPY